MFTRVTPFKTFAWERDLIVYSGTVVIDYTLPTPIQTQTRVYCSPGVSVGIFGKTNDPPFRIYLTDKVALRQRKQQTNILPATSEQAVVQGFANTPMIFFNQRLDSVPVTSLLDMEVSPMEWDPDLPYKVSWDVYPTQGGTFTGFSFKILMTGQPQKFVQGLGA